MKYKIHTITILTFFLIVVFGLAFNHFTDENNAPSTVESVETDSPELHTIMRLLLSDMDRINEGIYTMNFSLIENGAAGINDHPPMAEKSLTMVKETLGERMDVFGSFDHTVHSRADSLRKAAAQRNMDRVLDNYRIIQQGCVSCHTAFQEEIRYERLQREFQNRE